MKISLRASIDEKGKITVTKDIQDHFLTSAACIVNGYFEDLESAIAGDKEIDFWNTWLKADMLERIELCEKMMIVQELASFLRDSCNGSDKVKQE